MWLQLAANFHHVFDDEDDDDDNDTNDDDDGEEEEDDEDENDDDVRFVRKSIQNFRRPLAKKGFPAQLPP